MNKYTYELTFSHQNDPLVHQAIGGEVNASSRMKYIKYYFEKVLTKGFNLPIASCDVMLVAIREDNTTCFVEIETPLDYDSIDICIDMDNDLIVPYFSKVERFKGDLRLLVSDRIDFELPYNQRI